MDGRALELLQFERIKEVLKGLAHCQLGRMALDSLTVSTDRGEILERYILVRQARRAIAELGPFPLGGVSDLEPLLARAIAPGAILDGGELREFLATLEALKGASLYFSRLGKGLEDIAKIASQIEALPQLRGQIAAAVGPRGEILDEASPRLKKIRAGTATLRKSIMDSLEALLEGRHLSSVVQELIVTQRGDRYVIPLKPGFRKYLEGAVHDQSASGATLYVEPLVTLEMNNRLVSLRAEEREEEQRILRGLTEKVASHGEELQRSMAAVGRLDLISSVATLSGQLSSVEPEYSDDGEVRLMGARHPLLVLRDSAYHGTGPKPFKDTVPVDIVMESSHRAIIISGVNAGGKTVVLKTLGLLATMAQAGMPIPAKEGSRLPIFKEIFVELGDEQDVEGDLSSFSAHLLNLKGILAKVGAESLVLLDELGTATDPVEGAALGAAVIDELTERGARVLVTTHLPGLTRYALLVPGVGSASVGFDEGRLEPTYQLHYGVPGSSHAFFISRRLGLSNRLIERASRYLEKGEEDLAALLREISRSRQEVEEERARLVSLKEQLKGSIAARRAALSRARAGQEEIVNQFREKAARLLSQAEAELSGLVRRKRPKGEVRKVGVRLMTSFGLSYGAPGSLNFASGVRVKILTLGREGSVIEASDGKQEALVQVGATRVTRPYYELVKIEGTTKPQRGTMVTEVQAPPDGRLNLIGWRVEDALSELDKFLDSALLSGLSTFEVIHGHGTGRLRRAVRDHLRGNRAVAGISPAAPDRGGNGVTIVTLRD